MKRRLAIAAVCLFLGAVINVLVAWGIGALVESGNLNVEPAAEGDDWPVTPPEGWPRPDYVMSSRALGFRNEGGSFGLTNGRSGPRWSMFIRSYGWPMLCGRTRDAGNVKDATYFPVWSGDWFEGVVPPPFLNSNPFAYNCLPLEPLWPGFAANTAFYGGLVWLVGFGPFVLRRTLRRRRGCCVRCGYDLAGLSRCPECGTGAKTAGVESA